MSRRAGIGGWRCRRASRAFLGIALLASSHGNAGGIFFGILFLLAVIAGTVVTGFWFHVDHLEWWQKGLAKAAYYPGGAFGSVRSGS